MICEHCKTRITPPEEYYSVVVKKARGAITVQEHILALCRRCFDTVSGTLGWQDQGDYTTCNPCNGTGLFDDFVCKYCMGSGRLRRLASGFTPGIVEGGDRS